MKKKERAQRMFRILSDVDETLVEEAQMIARASASKKTRYQRLQRYASIAAGVCVLIGGVFLYSQVMPQQDSKQELQGQQQILPNLTVDEDGLPLLEFEMDWDGMGFEGMMAYEYKEIENETPWQVTDEIEALPVMKNQSAYRDISSSLDVVTDEEDYAKMREIMQPIAEYFDIEVSDMERIDYYATQDALSVKKNGVSLIIDADYDVRIEYVMPQKLPEHLNAQSGASYEEMYAVAEYVIETYRDLFAYKNPQIAIQGADYYFSGERSDYRICIYNQAETIEETLLNYHASYVRIAFHEDGTIWFMDIAHEDTSQMIGNYPIISVEEAKKLLVEGHYATSYDASYVPKEEYIRGVELMYRLYGREEYHMPYYRFWIEVPVEKQENGLNCYVAYYVPAIESQYITNMSTYGGEFN